MWKRCVILVLVLLISSFAGLSLMMGGPAAAYGFVRYTAPRMSRGEVKLGDRAPNIELLALDGKSRLRLHDRIGSRPLVVIFGSYT